MIFTASMKLKPFFSCQMAKIEITIIWKFHFFCRPFTFYYKSAKKEKGEILANFEMNTEMNNISKLYSFGLFLDWLETLKLFIKV